MHRAQTNVYKHTPSKSESKDSKVTFQIPFSFPINQQNYEHLILILFRIHFGWLGINFMRLKMMCLRFSFFCCNSNPSYKVRCNYTMDFLQWNRNSKWKFFAGAAAAAAAACAKWKKCDFPFEHKPGEWCRLQISHTIFDISYLISYKMCTKTNVDAENVENKKPRHETLVIRSDGAKFCNHMCGARWTIKRCIQAVWFVSDWNKQLFKLACNVPFSLHKIRLRSRFLVCRFFFSFSRLFTLVHSFRAGARHKVNMKKLSISWHLL